MSYIDMTGQTFNKLFVIGLSTRVNRARQRFWVCRCVCGSVKEVLGQSLRRGDIVSCGCFAKQQRAIANTKHGMYKNLTYKSWDNMKQRCLNPKHASYKHYGSRGIQVCKEWMEFKNFFADMGSRPSPAHSIERINNELGYFKDNCKWALIDEQVKNKRQFSTNSSGYTGVSFNKKQQKWRAYICFNRKQNHLGYFDSAEKAAEARSVAQSALWLKDQ